MQSEMNVKNFLWISIIYIFIVVVCLNFYVLGDIDLEVECWLFE